MNVGETDLTLTIHNETAVQPKEIYVEKKAVQFLQKLMKKSIDLVAGLFGTMLLLPITIFVYIMNKKNGEQGPIFYSQLRIGKDGKLFKMYKYRTMVINADEVLNKILEENAQMKDEFRKYKKLKKDPRITKIGYFLRKTSLDEFPQFINILKGEMSLVGPRPYMPREKEDMGNSYKTIIKCKPGITGLWQTSGRNTLTFEDRLNLDMEYYENHSVKQDLKLVIRTIQKTIKKEGAI